ncbi:DNA-binding transcriptional dual regulator Fur [Gammaproteobacteria bacterium]
MSENRELRKVGLKATLPRLKILRLFETASAQRHLSAEDVYRELVAEGEDLGLATIYRVLTQFEAAGILTRHHFEGNRAIFELNQGRHHDHLVCHQCGKVVEFYDAEIERRQEVVALGRGFRVRDHSLYLYADCLDPHCPNLQTAMDLEAETKTEVKTGAEIE